MPTKTKASAETHVVRVRPVRPGAFPKWWRGVCTEPSCSFDTGELAEIACRLLARAHISRAWGGRVDG